jgi:hypothetical protein
MRSSHAIRRGRLAALIAAVVTVAGLLPGDASAIPVFARKYGFDCTMCHSAFPRLNDFGQRFRANGYRLPGLEATEKTVWETPAPVALRTSAGYNHERIKDSPAAGKVSQFELNGLDLVSGGLMSTRAGYFLIAPPEVKPSKGVAAQEGTIEMASVVLSDLGSPWLNLRVGRFEPGCVAFSVKRSLSVSPYAVYDLAMPGGVSFADTQVGLECAGHGCCGFSYAAGWVNGSPTNLDSDKPADVYLRVAKVIGPGEGQTAGHRLGAVAYLGQARPDSTHSRESWRILGADGSFCFGPANLALQWLFANYDRSLWGVGSDPDFNGGFAEFSVMPKTNHVGFARYDVLNAPSDIPMDAWALTAGVRGYFAPNLALHAEISHRVREGATAGASDEKDDFATARLDFAF